MRLTHTGKALTEGKFHLKIVPVLSQLRLFSEDNLKLSFRMKNAPFLFLLKPLACFPFKISKLPPNAPWSKQPPFTRTPSNGRQQRESDNWRIKCQWQRRNWCCLAETFSSTSNVSFLLASGFYLLDAVCFLHTIYVYRTVYFSPTATFLHTVDLIRTLLVICSVYVFSIFVKKCQSLTFSCSEVSHQT